MERWKRRLKSEKRSLFFKKKDATPTCSKCGKDFFSNKENGDFNFVRSFIEERIVKNSKTGELYCWDCGKSELQTGKAVGIRQVGKAR